MADEAFALHFLEDAYAAGHIAGSWGDASQRQGTHDYYNQNGLEVFTWSNGGQSVVLMGDANLRPEDASVAATAVRRSLEQVLDAATGSGNAFAYTPDAVAELNNFDICRNKTLPDRAPGTGPRPEDVRFFEATLRETPVPGLGPGLGAMPRFRSEVGPFIGLAGSIDARWVDGGFVASQGWGGFVGGLDLSVRAGFGLDGVMGEAGDGLVYASVGFRTDSPSSNRFGAQVASGGNLGAAIPARSGLALRLRMPFYVVPGDLLLLAPLYLVNPSAYTQVAVRAANGGLIPWESGWSTAIGRFQFVLGREIGVTLYGLSGRDQLIAPGGPDTGVGQFVSFKSTMFEIPILEYRPYRAFSTNQSSSVVFQLFAAADVPHGGSVNFPRGSAAPPLHTVWSIGLRLVFDWRYYY
ncbi:hypothetical protein CupriaWKF_17760 [Cupriavidus sp. WKF15]|uniref:hypothetical protein n=1 Tax=Cupriavidus sp. WKF15 TaxID=3032282 RepID=UPI0023E3357C|nr:hypothetical protein [Cupriavidus sp. WKF15]WER49025.1 hypothetical protein CupriaWKF_17760 [Cupriavidus sp. WKF15]